MELNDVVDALSKRTLSSTLGICYYEEFKDGELVSRDHLNLFYWSLFICCFQMEFLS
jgi:hypothetical protein